MQSGMHGTLKVDCLGQVYHYDVVYHYGVSPCMCACRGVINDYIILCTGSMYLDRVICCRLLPQWVHRSRRSGIAARLTVESSCRMACRASGRSDVRHQEVCDKSEGTLTGQHWMHEAARIVHAFTRPSHSHDWRPRPAWHTCTRNPARRAGRVWAMPCAAPPFPRR